MPNQEPMYVVMSVSGKPPKWNQVGDAVSKGEAAKLIEKEWKKHRIARRILRSSRILKSTG